MEIINEIERIGKNRNLVKLSQIFAGDSSRKQRVAIYVDYPNLYGGARDNNGYPNMKLIRQIGDCLGDLVVCKFYTLDHNYENERNYILGMERMGYEIVTRHTTPNSMGERKDIDCLLITDFLKDLYTLNLDIMMIVSDDSDYAQPIREAKRLNKTCVALVSCYSKARIIADTATVYLTEQYVPEKNKANYSDENNLNDSADGGELVEN